MRKIIFVLTLLSSATELHAQTDITDSLNSDALKIEDVLNLATQLRTNVPGTDTGKIDDGIIGESRKAMPIIGIDSLGKYLQSKIPQSVFSSFNNSSCDYIIFDLKIDEKGNLLNIRPVRNFELNKRIAVEIIENLSYVREWEPALSIAGNGVRTRIGTEQLLFVYISKILIGAEVRFVIHAKISGS